MKPYPKYKDSGVEWIGEVPEGWEVKRIKYFFRLITEKNCSLQMKKVALENIESWTGHFIDSEGDYQGEGILFRKGDVLFGKLRPYLAKVLNAKFSGASVGDIFVMRPEFGISSRFAFYRFLSKPFIDIVDGSTFGAKMPRVSWNFIANLPIAVPIYDEQTAIAAYLDRKITQIDDLISKKQKLIALLKEERAAIINHAVTKGLNPDAPMKDSGIEWLGEVPQHWEIKKLKYVAEINPSKSAYIEFRESNKLVTFLPMEKVSEEGRIQTDIKKSIRELWNGFTCFEENDVIIAKITPCFENGKGALITNLGSNIGFGSTEFHVIRPRCLPKEYLFYITRTDRFMKFGEALMTGAAGQKRVPNEFIENYFVCYPKDKNEQNEISSFIHQKTTKIDQTISKIKKQIDLLQEYRTALISEVVTGKIDVRT